MFKEYFILPVFQTSVYNLLSIISKGKIIIYLELETVLYDTFYTILKKIFILSTISVRIELKIIKKFMCSCLLFIKHFVRIRDL